MKEVSVTKCNVGKALIDDLIDDTFCRQLVVVFSSHDALLLQKKSSKSFLLSFFWLREPKWHRLHIALFKWITMVIILFYFQMQCTVNSSMQDVSLKCGIFMLIFWYLVFWYILVHPWSHLMDGFPLKSTIQQFYQKNGVISSSSVSETVILITVRMYSLAKSRLIPLLYLSVSLRLYSG